MEICASISRREVGTTATAEMNATEFVDDSNETFSGNLSVQPTRSYHNSSDEAWSDFTVTDALVYIIIRGAYALGIPGNILSAIVWLRLHLANENQSAIFKPQPRTSVLTPSVEVASNKRPHRTCCQALAKNVENIDLERASASLGICRRK